MGHLCSTAVTPLGAVELHSTFCPYPKWCQAILLPLLSALKLRTNMIQSGLEYLKGSTSEPPNHQCKVCI